jgi:hypothetical protein
LWVAPPLTSQAAEVLGTLQWRYGDLEAAAQTLARHGSSRLKKMASLVAKSTELRPQVVQSLIGELSRDGRWPGESLTRIEALTKLVPACEEKALPDLQALLARARESIADTDVIGRGSSQIFRWSADNILDEFEFALWNWQRSSDALTSAERWIGTRLTQLSASDFARSKFLGNLDQLFWRYARGPADVARMQHTLMSLIEACAGKIGDPLVDSDMLLGLVLDAAEMFKVPLANGQLAARIERCLGHVPPSAVKALRIKLAQLTGDTSAAETLLTEVVANNADTEVFASLEAIIAANCPPVIDSSRTLALVRVALHSLRASIAGVASRPLFAPKRFTRAALVGEVSRSLLLRDARNAAELEQLASELMDIDASFVEYLAIVPLANEALIGRLNAGIVALLQGSSDTAVLSRDEWRYAGLRATLRVVKQRGSQAVCSEILYNIARLTAASDASLAWYATWVLGEWARSTEPESMTGSVADAIGATFRAAAQSEQVRIRAAGIAGVIAISVNHTTDVDSAVLEVNRADDRLAIRRAFDP